MIYTVHFITSTPKQAGHNWEAGKYCNAVVRAANKTEAIKEASQRPIFGEAFLVVVRHHSDIKKAKAAMIKKYGHHKGIF